MDMGDGTESVKKSERKSESGDDGSAESNEDQHDKEHEVNVMRWVDRKARRLVRTRVMRMVNRK